MQPLCYVDILWLYCVIAGDFRGPGYIVTEQAAAGSMGPRKLVGLHGPEVLAMKVPWQHCPD
jgi:hypothetical protein